MRATMYALTLTIVIGSSGAAFGEPNEADRIAAERRLQPRRTDGGRQRKSLGRQCREAVGVEIESPHRERKMIIPPLSKGGARGDLYSHERCQFSEKIPLKSPFFKGGDSYVEDREKGF